MKTKNRVQALNALYASKSRIILNYFQSIGVRPEEQAVKLQSFKLQSVKCQSINIK